MSHEESQMPTTSAFHAEKYEVLLQTMRQRAGSRKRRECFSSDTVHQSEITGESEEKLEEDTEQESVDTSEEGDIQSKEKEDRLGKNDWCQCSNCSAMPTVIECVCCHEEPLIKALIPDDASCIIEWHRFKTDIIDPERVDCAFKLTNSQKKKKPNKAANMRAIRKAAYRCFSVGIRLSGVWDTEGDTSLCGEGCYRSIPRPKRKIRILSTSL
ncbi:uncharacterized protein LOC108648313 [Xenopus tropicalis]|uniref:Uncharacterized protein LOC108648313 n=1 Tax=Xenopus tropicalis TaxID=8364 RepID=A0A8J1IRL0_XENTR|nr:uncharacterized protein LOC108648313 [Xenopus tropicalis]